MASAKNAEVRVLDRRSRRGRHRAFRRGHARSPRKTLFPSSRSALPSLRLLMRLSPMPLGCSLTDAISFIFPSCHQEARRPVPAPARASPRPRTRPLPGPARPPSPLPRSRLPRMRRRPRPRPRPPPAREHPRRSRPSGAAVPPPRISYAAVDRSLPRHRYAPVPSSHRQPRTIATAHRDRFFGFAKRFAKQNLTLNRSTPHPPPIHTAHNPAQAEHRQDPRARHQPRRR